MRQLSEESRYSLRSPFGVPRHVCADWSNVCSLDRLTEAAEELSKGTGNVCIPAQADVRRPDELKEAVRKTIEKFGRIDFAICGGSNPLRLIRRNHDLTSNFFRLFCW